MFFVISSSSTYIVSFHILRDTNIISATQIQALNYLGSLASVPVLAAALANKGGLLKKVADLARGSDEHEPKPEEEQEDEEEDEEEPEEEDEEDQEDPEGMAQSALSLLVNLSRSPAAAPRLCAEPAVVSALQG